MVAGMTLSPSSRVTVCTGRTKCTSLAPQRISFGIGSFASEVATIFGSSASVLSPFTWARYSSHSPLSVVRRSAWSTVIPQPRAQPSAALLGLPSASNAWAIAGPRFSISRSGCASARLATFNARRRGAANH
ncbi:Uncharacterised protein [Shigella sonnei]|nr:Uncharacterised protein [Shigella sonnei]